MKNNNQINIPEARAAMDKFKMEAASEVGVNLKEGYNGDLTSREAGSVGGQMVKKMSEASEPSLTYDATPTGAPPLAPRLHAMDREHKTELETKGFSAGFLVDFSWRSSYNIDKEVSAHFRMK